MSIPCEFRTFGCRVEIQYKEKEAHERVCKYRPYICPYIECDHKLAADAVVVHVSTAHRSVFPTMSYNVTIGFPTM